jgi:AraC family transcriptional regulator of adaptative response/methylated-DNA-[protein]-cysteine methyltransferase
MPCLQHVDRTLSLPGEEAARARKNRVEATAGSRHSGFMTKTPVPLSDRSVAYDRMADALAHLGETWRDWPDLSRCAHAMGLSPYHFQREFTRWAGISPKQFQAALAHAEAGDLLRQGASVLDAAMETGLSGPSRLHDLFIAHEGLSPGEAKSGGGGARLTIGEAETPFGAGVFLVSPRGLCGLGFADDEANAKTGFEHPGYTRQCVIEDLSARYPNADVRRDDGEAARWAQLVFQSSEPAPVALYGTPFRRQIWRALLDIPSGETRTYGEVAAAAGQPKAARAAGTAIGANNISWLIPCHRALASDGRLHNYHWGVARKRAMLTYERAHAA